MDVQPWIDKLNAMNKSELLDFFRTERIKATPKNPHMCLISRFIRNQINGVQAEIATSYVWKYQERHAYCRVLNNCGDVAVYYLDPTVADFIKEFDNHAYPELVTDAYKEANLVEKVGEEE